MSLSILSSRDLASYFNSTSGQEKWQNGSRWIEMELQLDNADRCLYNNVFHIPTQRYITAAGDGQANTGWVCAVSPLLINAEGDQVVDLQNQWLAPLGGGNKADAAYRAIGEYDEASLSQRIYAAPGGITNLVGGDPTVNRWQELDQLTLLPRDYLPNYGPWDSIEIGPFGKLPQPGVATPGWWGAPNRATAGGAQIFFETYGYMWAFGYDCTHTDLATYQNCAVKVDLSTGDGTLELDFVLEHSSTPTPLGQGPIFGLETQRMIRADFVPDIDSNLSAPKGTILIASKEGIFDTPYFNVVFKYYDFNPENIPPGSSGIPRTHGRERFRSKSEFLHEATVIAGPKEVIQTMLYPGLVYNPTTLTWENFGRNSTVATPANTATPIPAGHTGWFRLLPAADLQQWSVVAPASPIMTNKSTIVRAVALGDLGERIPSVTATWTLERVSTVKELLAPTGQGGTAQLDQVPVDLATYTVYENDLAMTESSPVGSAPGADEYSMNVATGEITFGANKGAGVNTYECTYRHSDSPALPPHGSLLSATSVTNFDGEATTIVRYEDDDTLIGAYDKCTVSDA